MVQYNSGERIVWLDQLKAISMYLVVLGHSIIKFKKKFIFKFIYSFHMALFFMISGMMFRHDKYDSMAACIKDKFIRLVFPYIMLNIIVIPLWYINMQTQMIPHDSIPRILLGILYSNSAIIRAPSNATWFLMTLFIAEVMYFALHHYLKDEKLIFVTSLLLAIIGVISPLGKEVYDAPWHLDVAFVAQFFYGCGYLLRKHFADFKKCFLNHEVLKVLLLIIVGIFFGIINKQVDMSNELYRNIIYTLITSFTLSFALIYIVQKIKPDFRLLSYIGKNTIIILAFHIPILRILQYLFPILYSRQLYCILASLIVFILVIPIIWIIKRCFPFAVKMPKRLEHFIQQL